MMAAPRAQQREIEASLSVGKENLLAVIPPLRNLMRDALRNHASDARHELSLADPCLIVQY